MGVGHFGGFGVAEAEDLGEDERLAAVGVMPSSSMTIVPSQEDLGPLITLMNESRPPEAVVNKGIQMFSCLADRKEAHGLVGKQITSLVVPPNMPQWAESRYHSHTPQPEIFGHAEVRIDGSDKPLVDDFTLRRLDGVAAGPKLGRNQPCWCGSGTKYKRCHGLPGNNGEGRFLIVELQKVNGGNGS